ncbi:hypothetical protein [Martelella sp. HB161492]|uniref:hypothetical protein n=1 Tax=Martelella sp. HB161492 TaxID=2720726 RepID=UPI00159230F9|nr:hypothetical protein [Martelella sp. HB161492]
MLAEPGPFAKSEPPFSAFAGVPARMWEGQREEWEATGGKSELPSRPKGLENQWVWKLGKVGRQIATLRMTRARELN